MSTLTKLGRAQLAALLSLALLAGCSIRQFAVDSIGDALASGGSVYESDDDMVLVGDALPFGVKLLDSLVAESPRHRGLLLAASRGYLLYAYGYVQFDAERVAQDDLDRANVLRARAHRLYLRALDYAQRGLEVTYPGLGARLAADPAKALQTVVATDDVPLLYATAASLGLGISTARQDAAMLARLPEVEALLQRALVLDESWNAGALHEFAVTWYAVRPGRADRRAAERHYERALALSGGRRAGLYVAYAEAVAVPAQNRGQFTALLERALAVPADADPNGRLLNALAQSRASWLLSRADYLFAE